MILSGGRVSVRHHSQHPANTVKASPTPSFLDGEVLVARIRQFLVLGRADLDLVGSAINQG